MKLSGRKALVTGGAQRIGRALCEALADKGCDVVVHYHRSALPAAELAVSLRAKGVQAYTVQGRFSDQEHIERVLAEAWKAAGGLDILVNNASVFHRHSLIEADEAVWMAEWQVNTLAPILLTRAFARARAAVPGPGRVINLLDRRVFGVEAGCLPYLLSKKMLADFTRAAAVELGPAVTVNGVAPGAILRPVGETDSGSTEWAGPAVLDHHGTPQDVADAMIYLLEAEGVTGQVIAVDAGQHLL